MNALRSFANQVINTVAQNERGGRSRSAQEGDRTGEAGTSGRLIDRLPEILFDESCSSELKLQQIWNKFQTAKRESKPDEAKILLQVLLRDVTTRLEDWRPNGEEAWLERHLRGEAGCRPEKGCRYGHPKHLTASLCSELVTLSQSVYYVLERELLSQADLQASGGLGLLHALACLMRSQYNQAAFLDAGGLQNTSKIVRNAINQLHVCTTASSSGPQGARDESQSTKMSYLYTLLSRCMAVISPFLKSTNVVCKEFKRSSGEGGSVHPLIACNVCSSQLVADYIELLQIIKSSGTASVEQGLAVLRLQASVLEIIKVAYEVNGDTDLLDFGIIESITSLLGETKYNDCMELSCSLSFFDVQSEALKVMATASQRHAVIVQHFLQSDGVHKLKQWMLQVLQAIPSSTGDGGREIVESAFSSLETQVGLCKDNERYIEALLTGVFGLLKDESELLWSYQRGLGGNGNASGGAKLASDTLGFKKHLLKWVAMLLLNSKYAITLLRRHKCWDILLGKNFFMLRTEYRRVNNQEENEMLGAVMKDALECQVLVTTLVYKTITSPWNTLPEIEMKMLLRESHLLALQPGSCVQLLNVLRKYVNSFKVARTAAILDKSDCSSGMARIIQKQAGAAEEEWEVLPSDEEFLIGVFDGPAEGSSVRARTRSHVLGILKDVFKCHILVEEYFIKQWNAVGALFSLIWESDLQDCALDMVKDLLKMSPSNTDAEIAKSVLFTRYVEALPRAQMEIHASGLKLVFMLLEGIQETITADLSHQHLFNECETILHVFNLLNENFSEDEGPELCRSVLKTLGYLISGNRQGRKHLERTVGWDTLQELVFHCVTTPIPYSVFLELFNIATDQIISRTEGKGVVHFVSVKLVPAMLNILRRCTIDNAKIGMRLINSVLKQSIANCSACDYHGVTAQLFQWFRECSAEERDLQDCIVNLIQTIGKVSLSAKDLRTVLRTCYGCESGILDDRKLLQTVSILRKVVSQDGPTDFLDFDGVQSGLRWKGKSSWGGSKAYSFSVWLRFDTCNLQQTQGKVLYSLQGKTGKTDQHSVVVVLESRRILIHTLESKLHSVSLDIDVPVGTWFQLGIVHDNSSTFGSSNVSLYLNGVKENVQKLKYPKNFDVLTGISIGCLPDEENQHNVYKWLSRLKGQVSSVFLFQDALYEKHMMQIYRIGPNVAFTRLIRGFNTGDMLFLALKEKAKANGVLYNVVQPGAPIAVSVLDGTHFCYTRVMKDMIQCIGGIGVVLTLFGHLYHNYASQAKASETLSSTMMQVFQLLQTLMGASHLYMNDMLHMKGFPILGFLIRKVDAQVIQPDMVEAIEEMLVWMLDAEDKVPFKQAFQHVLLDLSWWSGVSDAVQKPYIELLLRTIRTEYRLVRGVVQISLFLDVLRSQKKKCCMEVDEQGNSVCSDRLVRGYLEAVVILMEKKFDENDLVALICFCNDNVHDDVTYLLLRRLNLCLKGERREQKRFSELLGRMGGSGLFAPMIESSNKLVCVEALELLLIGSEDVLRGEELVIFEVLLEGFGAKLASSALGNSLLLKLVSLLKTGKHSELYVVSVLFQILPKVEVAQRKVVLSYCVKLLSRARNNVEAFVTKSAWQKPLVGQIEGNLSAIPGECRVSLSKTGNTDVTNEVAICWNILISLIFYCVRYKDNGHATIEETMYYFLWGQNYRKEDSSVLFPQLISDTLKMVLLSDQTTRSASDSWTTVEALDCEACINNVVGILPLCQDILLGVFLEGKPSTGNGKEGVESEYDVIECIRSISMGKEASDADLCREMGFGSHVLDGRGEPESSPVHEALASEFCEVCVSIIYKLLFGTSAHCFLKYVSMETDKEGGGPGSPSARVTQSPSRAGESLSQDNVRLVFQVTMSLFTMMLNAVTEESKAKVIAKDICSIVEYCILSSHDLSDALSAYIKAVEFLKENKDARGWHKDLCQSMFRSLSYAKDKRALETEVSKLLSRETVSRAQAQQERMLRITSVEKRLQEDAAKDSAFRFQHAERGKLCSGSYSEQDASRRVNEGMNLLESCQEVETHWKHMQRKLRSEKGIWASGREQNLKWKLDSTEDYLRRRMKVKRLYTVREYTTSSSLGEKESDVVSDGQLIKNLSIKMEMDEDLHLQGEFPSEGLQESQDFQEADDGSQVSPESRLQRSESIAFDDAVFSTECKLVTVKRIVPGKIHISERKVYFSGKVQEHSNLFGQGMPDPSSGKSKRACINVDDIREIHFMRYMLEYSACEIFLQHKGVFLAFSSREEMKRTVKRITVLAPSILVVSRRKRVALAELYSSQWRKGEISNFSYLMKLNTLAGRTFNDLSQYPVFPWVLSDYESGELDLDDPGVYRDLTKPVGALSEKRKELVMERYSLSIQTDDPARAFHYGSHYSTAGIVLYYLIRMEPFTFLHSVLQGGKLDHADRLFNSVSATWSMCNHHSADVKELIPEFFCLPEMFENMNSIDFGICQDGVKHPEVALPPWAKGSPVEFVRIHKKALESDYVSSNLHSWIDLIFGYKQRGKAAVEAVNVFHYLSYEGSVDISTIEDERERKVVMDHVLHFGQTPSQLFRKKQSAKSAKGGQGMWAKQDSRMALSRMRVSPPRAIRYCTMVNSKFMVIDDDAVVHYYRWVTPKDTSFTFTASASSTFSLEHEKTTESLKKQYGSTMSSGANHFAVLGRSGVLLSIGHWDNSIRCYNLDDFKCIQSVSCHKDAITCVAVGFDEKVVVTGSRDTTVIVWKIQRKAKSVQPALEDNPLHILYGHQDEVSSIALSVPLDLVISASIGGDILFHTLQTGEYVRQLQLPSGHVPSKMALNPNGVLLIYCQADLKLYTMTMNGKVLASADIGERVTALAFTRTQEGDHVVLGGEKGTVSVRDLYLRQVRKFDATVGVTDVTVTPEDCVLVTNRNGEIISITTE
ncbi:BEACH domain-containing protein [Chloropicon primus]|uniref:BEACH domain-containing protein n=1 Tax=Chloropicon primus TaxID=1764295 RepID=A0A5B8MW21_9CHLO|nr:BEACH domain-containing protein [Chloropicon primus]|eukprot:QDZ23815.1 BEACH domain-containing protein [Chloropicon primus]